MRRFIFERALHAAGVVFVAVTLAFMLAHIAPGDPFGSIDDPRVTPAQRELLRAQWGYDRPIYAQYLTWIGNIARGNLGWSHAQNRYVSTALADALPNTLILAIPALIIGVGAGIALGTWQASRRRTRIARASNVATLALISTPDYVIATLAFMLFAMKWRLAPPGGIIDPVMHDTMSAGGRLIDIAKHLVVPGTVLALMIMASVSRYQRTAMLGVLHHDFIRTAHAKGVPPRRIIWRHALRNALGPVVSIGGVLVPAVFAGTVFIEKIFNWPGMGLTALEAVTARDYAVVQGVVLLGTLLATSAVALSDILGALVNPRVRLDA